MAQTIPGSQSEERFELLHANADGATTPPPPAPPSDAADPIPSSPSPPPDSTTDGSPAPHHPPIPTIIPNYDFQLTHAPNSAVEEAPPPSLHRPAFAVLPGEHHQGSIVGSTKYLANGRSLDSKDDVVGVTMDAIDRTVKQYTHNILQVLDGISGRLVQLETKVQGLDLTVGELKASEGERQDQTLGRLMKLETLMEEVHRGVQRLHGNQRLDEAKPQLSNFDLAEQRFTGEIVPQATGEGWHQPKAASETLPHAAFPESSSQLQPQFPPQYPFVQSQNPHASPAPQMQGFGTSQSMLPFSSPLIAQPGHQQPFLSTEYVPSQHQQSSQQSPQPPPQVSFQIPTFHSQSAPQPSPPTSYNMPIDTAAFNHTPTPPHLPPPHVAPSSSYLPEPSHYVASMHGGIQQLPMPQDAPHLSQQHNPAGSQHTYDSPPGRMGSIPQSYGHSPLPKPGLLLPSKYEGHSSGYGGTPYRSAHSLPSSPSGGAGYPRLPTAQPVQHDIPSANPVSRPAMRSSVDDVINQVCNMGFSREQTREAVRQLTEYGQAVDMNVVLDRLMNGGSSQNARGWFNRG